MKQFWLCFTLLSDATFGRGDGLAGVVDREVDHDQDGLPYLHGRTLKGLLNEECANIRFHLAGRQPPLKMDGWDMAAQNLFGGPGSSHAMRTYLNVGPAQLPAPLRRAVKAALRDRDYPLTPADVLESLTAIRHQTAVNEVSGAPEDSSLRAMRVVLRQTQFEASLSFDVEPQGQELPLLAACVLALRRAGTGRNRGRGKLEAYLHADDNGRPGEDLTFTYFQQFMTEVAPCQS